MTNMAMATVAPTTLPSNGSVGIESNGTDVVNNDMARLTVRLPASLLRRLEEIQNNTAASSATEVVKNAIVLYDALVEQRLKGGEVCVKFPHSDTEAIIPIFVSR